MNIKIVVAQAEVPLLDEHGNYINLEVHRGYHELSSYFGDDFEIDPEQTKYLRSRSGEEGLVLVKHNIKYVAVFGDGGVVKIEKTLEQVNDEYRQFVAQHNAQAQQEHVKFMNFINQFKG